MSALLLARLVSGITRWKHAEHHSKYLSRIARMLHPLPSGTLLDCWAGQGVEGIRSELCFRDSYPPFSNHLETLLWTRQSCRPATRGVSLVELSISRLWRHGPDWLGLTKGAEPLQEDIQEHSMSEMKLSDRTVYSLLTGMTTISLEDAIPCKSYSSITRLLLVTTYVFRFVRALKGAVKQQSTGVHPCQYPSPQELSEVETVWFKEIQRQIV